MDRTQGKEPDLDDREHFRSFRRLCATAAKHLDTTNYDLTSYTTELALLSQWINNELHRLATTATPW